MLVLVGFLAVFLIFGTQPKIITSSASLPVVVMGSRIYNFGTIYLPGEGYDFRSVFGIGESLIHSLAGFINLPLMSLWHPFLWVSQYLFIFFAILEFTKQMQVRKMIGLAVGMVIVVWTATSPMNWLHLFYIHVHLFSSFAFIIFVYFFWQMTISKSNEPGLALICALALMGYALSRVESPIMIFAICGVTLITHRFEKLEYRIFYYPLILLEIIWLGFLFIAYRGTDTQYWSDDRLIMAMIGYLLLLITLLINQSFRLDLKLGVLRVFLINSAGGDNFDFLHGFFQGISND